MRAASNIASATERVIVARMTTPRRHGVCSAKGMLCHPLYGHSLGLLPRGPHQGSQRRAGARSPFGGVDESVRRVLRMTNGLLAIGIVALLGSLGALLLNL